MSEDHLQLCRFCQRTIKLAYYCEDCGTSCCTDCLHEEKIEYFVCQECNSKNIEILDSGGRKVCKDCGRESIVKASQKFKECPKCKSHSITNIYEKKEKLEQNFLEIIQNTRSFLEPFVELRNKLLVLRDKIKLARDPPIRCYHFPRMEADLYELFKLFNNTTDNLLEKISVHFQHFALNKEYFFDIYMQPNSNIKIIEGILENLIRSYDSIKDFIANSVKTINQSIETNQINLQFIDKINVHFSSHQNFLNLAKDEKPVFAINAKLTNGLNSQELLNKSKGTLFITNFDLSFVHEHGLLKKKQEIIFKAPVDDLVRIKEKGKVFKKLYLEFAYGKYEFTLPANTVKKVIEYILLARTFDETTKHNKEFAKKLQEITVDLTDLVNFIEESINSFFSLKCQYNQKLNNEQIMQNEMSYKNQLFLQNFNLQQDPVQYSNPQKQMQYFGSQDQVPYRNQQDIQRNSQPFYQNLPPVFQNIPELYHSPNDYPPPDNSMYYRQERYYDPRDKNSQRPPLPNSNMYNPDPRQPPRPEYYAYDRRNGWQCEPDLEERNFLMKRLEQVQKIDNQPHYHAFNSTNKWFNKAGLNRRDPQDISLDLEPSIPNLYDNHLSDLFVSRRNSSDRPFSSSRKDLYEFDRSKRKKLSELKQERYGLKETLKKLDSKFDQGGISEVDYFRTFKNLQKQIYAIDKKVNSLNNGGREYD